MDKELLNELSETPTDLLVLILRFLDDDAREALLAQEPDQAWLADAVRAADSLDGDEILRSSSAQENMRMMADLLNSPETPEAPATYRSMRALLEDDPAVTEALREQEEEQGDPGPPSDPPDPSEPGGPGDPGDPPDPEGPGDPGPPIDPGPPVDPGEPSGPE
jgi:hypothetical protein